MVGARVALELYSPRNQKSARKARTHLEGIAQVPNQIRRLYAIVAELEGTSLVAGSRLTATWLAVSGKS